MGSIGKRETINHAKSELRNLKYLKNVCKGFKSQIIRYETALEGVRSPSDYVRVEEPIYVDTREEFVDKEYRRADLLDRLQTVKKNYAPYRARVENIVEFLDGLEFQERKIVTDIYIDNMSIEDKAIECYCSETTLNRRIDDILVDFMFF